MQRRSRLARLIAVSLVGVAPSQTTAGRLELFVEVGYLANIRMLARQHSV
jgi:hypothetical protein